MLKIRRVLYEIMKNLAAIKTKTSNMRLNYD
jgi:hypothetical protein